jgi:hypothetical protein
MRFTKASTQRIDCRLFTSEWTTQSGSDLHLLHHLLSRSTRFQMCRRQNGIGNTIPTTILTMSVHHAQLTKSTYTIIQRSASRNNSLFHHLLILSLYFSVCLSCHLSKIPCIMYAHEFILFYAFGCFKFSAPSVTTADEITSPSFITVRKSAPSTT